MAVRQDSDRYRLPTALARVAEPLRGASRYDLVLAVIPLAFLFGAVTHAVSRVPLRVALVLAAVVCVVALADALFLNPPRGSRPS